jgi:amino acid transporter
MPPDLDPVELWMTLAALLGGGALVAAMAILERRPRKGLTPHLLPTTPLLFVGVVVGLLALVHLLNLWGIHTGRQ